MDKHFSIADIARALGQSKQAAHKHLRNTPPDQIQMKGGNTVHAWKLESLPTSISLKLAEAAARKGYKSICSLLERPAERFALGHPISAIHPDCICKAQRLQKALVRAVESKDAPGMTITALEKLGRIDWHREFGSNISSRHWRRIFERTLYRDAGHNEFDRLDIYFDDQPRLARVTGQENKGPSLEVLNDAVNAIESPASPSRQEIDYLWVKACDQIHALIEEGSTERHARATVLDRLLALGYMGKTEVGITKALSRKWKAYQAGHDPVDRRTVRCAVGASGVAPSAIPEHGTLSENDLSLLTAKALERGGRLAQAWRETYQAGEFSQLVYTRYAANPANKSEVPKSVKRIVSPMVRRLMVFHRSPRDHEIKGARYSRHLKDVFAGEVFQGDDTTPPVYFWEPWNCPRGFRIIQGQFLIMIDFRSQMVLSFLLHSDRGYNSRGIRTLILKTHDEFGLPKQFYFERGIWKDSKILTGDKEAGTIERGDTLGFNQTELGLREFGIKFSHAKYPTGKLVEGVFRLVQTHMERLPGYTSRDPIHARNERVEKQKREAESGKVHPSKYFLSKEEIVEQYAQILNLYNQEVQQGKHLNGISPLDAWNSHMLPSGTIQLGGSARYLLAHHKLAMKVQRSGIKLRQSLGGGNYCNADTGRYVGEKVLVWVNPDSDDYIAFTSLDRKQGPFVVPKQKEISAIHATKEEMEEEGAKIFAHNHGWAKTVYRAVAPHFASRKFISKPQSQEIVEVGQRISNGVEQVRASQTKARNSGKRIQALSRELGLPAPKRTTDSEANLSAEGYDLIKQARELNSKTEQNK